MQVDANFFCGWLQKTLLVYLHVVVVHVLPSLIPACVC